MSKNRCGGFAATVGTGEAYYHQQKSVGGGLTIFCPDDKAVAAFDPTFKSLPDDGQLAVLLHDGVPTCYSEKALEAVDGEVETFASDGAGGSFTLMTVRDNNGGTVKLSPSSSSRSEARVTKTVVDMARIDAVLLPGELLDGSGAPASPAPSPANEDGADAEWYWWWWFCLGMISMIGCALVALAALHVRRLCQDQAIRGCVVRRSC